MHSHIPIQADARPERAHTATVAGVSLVTVFTHTVADGYTDAVLHKYKCTVFGL